MVFFNFIVWYYTGAIGSILRIWRDFLKFFWLYFLPMPVLIKTLFSPWKRDITSYAGPGFDFGLFFQKLAFNAVSRSIGAVIRIFAIALGLALEGLTLIAGFAVLFFWLVLPLLFLLSVFLYDGLSAVFLPFLLLTFLFYLTAKQKSPDRLNLEEVLKKKWAKIIWERLGVSEKDVFKGVVKNPKDNLENFLKQKNIKTEDFETALAWEVSAQKAKFVKKRFWRPENLFSFRGFARGWAYGFTSLLDRYSERIDSLANYEHLIGRTSEIELIERILSKGRQSNALIIGKPGVGKMSLVQKFSRMVDSGNVSGDLAYRSVILLDLKRALAGLENISQLEEKLIRIFNQARSAGNVILVIDDFHNFVSTSLEIGGRDISRILVSFLEGGSFQLIAVTTYRGLHDYVEKNEDMMNYFEKVELKEPDRETTKKICQDSVREIELRVPARITVQAINAIIDKSDAYITDLPFPEKAIDLIEETAIYVAKETGDYFVSPSHVDHVISQKTEIPVGELSVSEKEKLVNLEEILHKRVINQNHAVESIASAMRRSRLEVGRKDRPIGSFLFLGPTGVGKTETAKALAENYFGSEDRINRFDMSEFQGAGAVEKMIGSAQTGKGGVLTTAVKENPFSLLLLDEIEKADYGVLNLFLQVLEEGWLTDGFGRKINFCHQIIIATSNAGANFIREKIDENFDEEELKGQLFNHVLEMNIFRPEFLNRFDDVVVFKPLTRENLLLISELMLNGLKKRLAKQDIIFNFGRDLVAKIADLGYDPANGARPMRRVIQKKLEDLIAKKLLKGEIRKDEPFEIKSESV